MATIVTRAGKGTTLTWAEMDANLNNINNKIIENVSLKDSGAIGDGITDDFSAIQTAINSGAKIIYGSGYTYKCNSKLTLRSDLILRDMTLDFSSLTALDGSYRICIKAEGSITDSSALASNAVEGAYTVVVTAGQGIKFSAGDYVLLTSEDIYNYPSASVKRGEIKQVESVATDTITFRESLYESYTTANTATLRKLSLINNVVLDNVNIIGSNIENHLNIGLSINYANNLQVINSSFTNNDLYNLALYNTINFSIQNNNFDGVRYTGTGVSFYGVVLLNCTQWGQVSNNRGQELRHLVTTTSSVSYYGQPYFISVNNNNMRNAMASDIYASWAYENHGFGRWIIWSNNIADSCYSGINLEKGDQLVIGNIFKNIRSIGVSFDTDGRELKNILISNNVISKVTSDSSSGTISGIVFQNHASQVRENILITSNIIEGFGLSGRQDFGIRIFPGSGNGKNCTLTNNLIINNGSYEITDYGAYIQQGGWQLRDNTIKDYERGISILSGANDVTVSGNNFSVTTISSTQPQLTTASNKNIFTNNIFRNVYRAIHIQPGATTTHCYNNTVLGSSAASLDNGTTSVLTQPAFA